MCIYLKLHPVEQNKALKSTGTSPEAARVARAKKTAAVRGETRRESGRVPSSLQRSAVWRGNKDHFLRESVVKLKLHFVVSWPLKVYCWFTGVIFECIPVRWGGHWGRLRGPANVVRSLSFASLFAPSLSSAFYCLHLHHSVKR